MVSVPKGRGAGGGACDLDHIACELGRIYRHLENLVALFGVPDQAAWDVAGDVRKARSSLWPPALRKRSSMTGSRTMREMRASAFR